MTSEDGKIVVALMTNGKAGLELADLQGVQSDLEHVSECCRRVVALANEDDTLAISLLDSASVRYRQCFKGGVRKLLNQAQVLKLSDVDVSLHDYFINRTDKYVAHSVNHLESPVSVVIPSDDRRMISGHMVITFDFGKVSPDRASAFGAFVEAILREIVAPARAALELKFADEVAGLSVEEISALIPLSVRTNLQGSDLLRNRKNKKAT